MAIGIFSSERVRTVFIAVIAAGIVALTIGYLNDVDQRNRSLKNCRNVQLVAEQLQEISVDVAKNTDDPEAKTRWARYADKFGSTIPPGSETCEQLFPPPRILP